MQMISVVIPFFQYEPGILTRALRSIIYQLIPKGWSVEVIVVDDGSPRPASDEIPELSFKEPLHLKVIRQENSGVAAARNRGLDQADQRSGWITFLDSDDIWPVNHLVQVIGAFQNGVDFYFTDNCRIGYHNSHIFECTPNTARYISATGQNAGIVEISSVEMVGLIIKELPTQASTVAYKRSLSPLIRFDTTLSAAGEDVLFFATLATCAKRIGFDLDNCVECGSGMNMYFGNLSWDSPKFLKIRVDQVRAHRLIAKIPNLSLPNKNQADAQLLFYRQELGFHTIRNLVKFPARVPKEIVRLVKLDPGAAILLPLDMLRAAVDYVFRSGTDKYPARVE